MDAAVAVGGGLLLTQGVDGVTLLLGGAGVAAALVGILDSAEDVVGVEVAARPGRDAVDELGLLVGAAGQVRLEREHVAGAVVSVLGGLIVVGARRAIDVRLNGLGRAAEVVVKGLVDDAARVGRALDPAGGVIGTAADQDGVGARWDAAGPGVGGAAVGADVDGVSQAVGQVVVASGVADARLRAGTGFAQLACRGLVVDAVLGAGQDDVAAGVVLVPCLGQDLFAGGVVGVGLGGVTAGHGR